MALPAKLLEQLRATGHGGHVGVAEAAEAEEGLPFGFDELDQALPDHGLLRGGVIEISARGKAALATTLGLLACRSVQEEGFSIAGAMPWCAFVDPTGSLYAPGVLANSVTLERLLVVRPPPEALARTALRLVESHAFSLVVVDTVGVPGALRPPQRLLELARAAWPRVVRRLALAVEGSQQSVILITDPAVPRSVIWPVTERLELSRPEPDALVLQVTKHKRGLVSEPYRLAWPPPLAQKLLRTRPTGTSSFPPPHHARLTA